MMRSCGARSAAALYRPLVPSVRYYAPGSLARRRFPTWTGPCESTFRHSSSANPARPAHLLDQRQFLLRGERIVSGGTTNHEGAAILSTQEPRSRIRGDGTCRWQRVMGPHLAAILGPFLTATVRNAAFTLNAVELWAPCYHLRSRQHHGRGAKATARPTATKLGAEVASTPEVSDV